MTLTPEDVSNKRFTTVRLREGYDMTEVDQFLDEVEAELARLTRENDELRAKVGAVESGQPLPTPVEEASPVEETTVEEAAVEEAAPVEERPVEEVPAPAAEAEPVTAVQETLQVTTTAEASAAAIRLLELAGRNADELVSDARQQAEEIVTHARDTAEQLETDARTRAESLDAETTRRRESALGDIERQREELDREIDSLRTFEREYRAELRSYFEQQLAALEGVGVGGSLSEQPGLPAPASPEESQPLP